jgi:glutathione S-transferase
MAPITVYSVPGSPFLASVLFVLEERQAPHSFVPLQLGEVRQPAHLARHPFGRMPAIEHDGFGLYETQAILRYIAEVFPGAPLVPGDPRAQARMNQLIGLNDWYFFPKVAAVVVFERLIKPRLLGQPTDEAAVASAQPMAATCIAEIARLMDGQAYMAGEALSLADLHLAPQLHYFALTPEGAGLLDRHRPLGDWLARMRQRPAMKKTMLMGM